MNAVETLLKHVTSCNMESRYRFFPDFSDFVKMFQRCSETGLGMPKENPVEEESCVKQACKTVAC